MKIETVIPLRKDGTVKVTAPSGTAYLFSSDDAGRVVADIADQNDAGWFLSLGDFFPADDSDFDAALELTNAAPVEDDEGEPDEEGDMNAAPVETPLPKRGKKK